MSRKIRIGINGLGVIGRTIFRVIAARELFQVVAVNDINDDVENLAYLIKYDSTHGVLRESITSENDNIIFNGSPIKVFSESKIEDVPWDELGVDIVVGCTGVLRNVANASQCLKGSVKKVVFSDSPKDVDFTFVLGTNETCYDHGKHNIIAGSICDVVGITPAIKILDDKYGIKSGWMLTLHPFLFYQNIKDGRPNTNVIKDPNGTPHAIGRASMESLIPKNTSLVKALERAMPKMKGKFKAMSYRVPTNLVSSANTILVMENDVNVEDVNNYLKSCRNMPILDYTEEPLVSVDYKHHESSCIIDGKWTEVIDNRSLRIVTWYDNEWGYSSRLVDIIEYISKNF